MLPETGHPLAQSDKERRVRGNISVGKSVKERDGRGRERKKNRGGRKSQKDLNV